MPAQAHGYPGISPAGRSPVVLHPNASHGLPPPYGAVPARRHGLGPSNLPEAGSPVSGTMKDALSRHGATKPKRAADAPEGTERPHLAEWRARGRSGLLSLAINQP